MNYKTYSEFILAHNRSITLLIILITACFILSLLNLRVNSSPYFMGQEHASRIHELDIKALFTNSGEQILVVLEPSTGLPLDRPTVEKVRKLTKQFEALTLSDQVDSKILKALSRNESTTELVRELKADPSKAVAILNAIEGKLTDAELIDSEARQALAKVRYLYHPIKRVRSFSTIENLTANDDEIDLHPLLPKGDLTKANLSQFQKEVLSNPLFKGLLISEDIKATSIQIEMTIPKDDNRNTGKLYAKIADIVASSDYDGELYLAGNPVIDAEMALSMERDNLVFFPFVILVISALLFIGFHSASGIFVPLVIASITAIWTLGLMVALGIEQNIVTTILPVFLLTVAVADAIHFYNHFLSSTNSNNPLSDRLAETYSHLTRPLILTSITTLIGFLALSWTDIIFIREFGLLMAVGVMFALIITLLVAPILIASSKTLPEQNTSDFSAYLSSLLTRLVSCVLENPIKSLAMVFAVLTLSLYALQFLKFDQENINNFSPSSTLRSHHNAIMEHYDGTIPIDVWIDTGEQGGLYNPTIINGIKDIEQYLNKRSDIGFVLSPVGFLERMYDLLTNEGHKLPSDLSEGLIAQEILVYENESSQDIKNVIDDMHRHARITVLGESDAASFWAGILKDIESMAPPGTHIEINGYGKVMHSNIQEVIKTNISSTIIALSLIALVMIVLFKSISIGVIGVVPLILTVIMNFAAMSVSGVAVDVGTTIVASIAFGIGIDYSIHYLSALKRLREEGYNDLKSMIIQATQKVGLPIMINSITLAGGFLVLLASNFLVLQLLGLFIAMTMLLAAINATILIPLLYFVWHRKAFIDDQESTLEEAI